MMYAIQMKGGGELIILLLSGQAKGSVTFRVLPSTAKAYELLNPNHCRLKIGIK